MAPVVRCPTEGRVPEPHQRVGGHLVDAEDEAGLEVAQEGPAQFWIQGHVDDEIDVDQPDGDPELVYPILAELLEGNRP